MEDDDHFYSLVRYVERNALRANLVAEAQAWRWSSLWRRESGDAEEKSLQATLRPRGRPRKSSGP